MFHSQSGHKVPEPPCFPSSTGAPDLETADARRYQFHNTATLSLWGRKFILMVQPSKATVRKLLTKSQTTPQRRPRQSPSPISIVIKIVTATIIILAIVHPIYLYRHISQSNAIPVDWFQNKSMSSLSAESTNRKPKTPTEGQAIGLTRVQENNAHRLHLRTTPGERPHLRQSLPQDSPGCLTDACVQQLASTIARAFPDRVNQSWCFREEPPLGHEDNANAPASVHSKDGNGVWRGIILVKVPKGASSTSAGVAIRIGRRVGCQAVQWKHRVASKYQRLHHPDTFLFTTVRDPAARAISTIFFHTISRSPKAKPTDDLIKTYLQQSKDIHFGSISEGQGGFQLRYTSLDEIAKGSAWSATNRTRVLHPEQVVANVRSVIDSYGFLLVTERMEESLVAMALVLGIDVADVLVTSSKVAGGSRYHFARMPKQEYKCLPTVKSFVSPGVAQYIDSDEWRAINYGDYLLQATANQSLDLTIARLGRTRFEAALSEFRTLRAKEQALCAPNVSFPCSNEGVPQPQLATESCYLPFFDFGCGHKCIDQMIKIDREERGVSGWQYQ